MDRERVGGGKGDREREREMEREEGGGGVEKSKRGEKWWRDREIIHVHACRLRD